MKTILLVRHAKSDWNDASLSDFDRPLNDRGKRDAPIMARRLKDKKIAIDAFVSSPAKRAKKTAIVFAKEYHKDKDDVILKEELYGAEEKVIEEVITSLDDKFDTVALFTHNPGITWFANQLTETRIDNIPTSGIFAVKADTDQWSEFSKSKKEFLFFEYPKKES